jgi:hypothetical protein
MVECWKIPVNSYWENFLKNPELELGVMALTCKPSTQEVETGGSQIWDQNVPLSEI